MDDKKFLSNSEYAFNLVKEKTIQEMAIFSKTNYN